MLSCPYCNKELKNNIDKELHIHTFHKRSNEFDFICHICSHRLKSIYGLRKHMRHKHGLPDMPSIYLSVHSMSEPDICMVEGCIEPRRFYPVSRRVTDQGDKFKGILWGFSDFCIKHHVVHSRKCASASAKKTNLDRYGVEIVFQAESVKEKIKKTNIDRYGGNTPFASDKVKRKAIETNLDRYGTEWGCQSDVVKEKIKNRHLELFGYNNAFQSEEVKNRIKNTILDRYGVPFISQSTIIKEKIRDTCLAKYNRPSVAQSLIDDYTWDILNDAYLLDAIQRECGEPVELAKQLHIGVSTLYNYFHLHKLEVVIRKGSSKAERDLAYWVKDLLGNNVITSDRDVIKPFELDIHVPKYKLAIEYNGLYWHSELSGGKDKNYHLNKTNMCKAAGIQLLHIFSSDNLDLWKSVIRAKLGLCDKIYARKCKVAYLDTLEANTFLDHNHLQGNTFSSIRLGLIYEDNIVAIMTFGKSRFDQNVEYELIRFCNIKNHSVIGGASKLLSYFIRKHKPSSIVSYANLRWSDGALYNKLGFVYESKVRPGYYYTRDYNKLYSRLKFQKHKLEEKLDVFDQNMSERENMRLNGWDRIWDCGQLKYTWRKHG